MIEPGSFQSLDVLLASRHFIYLRSFPSLSSFSTLLQPWCTTSAIQMLLILKPNRSHLCMSSSHKGSYSSFGKPFACAAIMVMSPDFGLVFLSGVYCLTAIYSTSSWVVAVARGKPRICDAGILCSSIRKNWEDMIEGDQARGASGPTVLKIGRIRRLLRLRRVQQEWMPWRPRPDGWYTLFMTSIVMNCRPAGSLPRSTDLSMRLTRARKKRRTACQTTPRQHPRDAQYLDQHREPCVS